MKRLKYETVEDSVTIANQLQGSYDEEVIFHCYWNGDLNEKHLYSIMSFYLFNVVNKGNKIILWIENNEENKYNEEISKYASILKFSQPDIDNNTFLQDYKYDKTNSCIYSDFVRFLILYKFGGVWFDLDCFCLRSFDPLFANFGEEICVYEWATENYPNGAILISLKKNDEKLKSNISYMLEYNRTLLFPVGKFTYDLPLDFYVLPCIWFDGHWVGRRNYGALFDSFFQPSDTRYNLDVFFSGSFCYHWHNRWNKEIPKNSIFQDLVDDMFERLNNIKD